MRLYAFHKGAPQSVLEWPSFAAKYGRPPVMPHLRGYRLVLLSVLAVVTAAVSTVVSSFRFSASLRPQGVNSETFQPPCLPHYSPYQASMARFFSACSSPLSLATSASSAAIASCRGVTPSCTTSLSVAYRPYLEERHYCQITPFFTDVKGPLCCFQSFILWKQTHQGHVRRWMNTLHLSWGCSIEDLSPFPASPPSHQRCLKFTGPSCGKKLSVEERNTAENAAVCDPGRAKELRAGYECSYRHPLSDDTTWRRTAFLAARHTPASCTLTVQQLGTTPATSTSRAPRRRPPEAKSHHQTEPLSAVAEALRPLLRKTSPSASGCAPLGLKPIPVKEGESPVRARVNYTSLKAAGSPVGGGFQRTLNVWQDRCVMRRLFVRPEQSKWKTLPNVKSGQALRTPLDGATQKIPLETSTDIDSVKYVSREHAVDKSHQIFVLGGDVELARGTLDASEQQHVGPPDKVLLGEKRGRLTVTLSNNHVHACVVDNRMQRTYAYASSFDKCLLREIGAIRRRRGLKPRPHGGTMKAAWAVGRLVAQRALAKGIKKVFFDRKSYRYIGRVKALADGAREGGLEF